MAPGVHTQAGPPGHSQPSGTARSGKGQTRSPWGTCSAEGFAQALDGDWGGVDRSRGPEEEGMGSGWACPLHPTESSSPAVEDRVDLNRALGQDQGQDRERPLVAGRGSQPSSTPDPVTSAGISLSLQFQTHSPSLWPAPGCLLPGPSHLPAQSTILTFPPKL